MPNGEPALCDSGPLIAIFDANDSAHDECRAGLRALQSGGVTTWPALAEAFYFLDQQKQREPLWDLLFSNMLRVQDIPRSDLVRMRELMAKYADLPMDFADASLVAIGERRKLRKVFTLDNHFRLYRPRHARAFEIFP